MKKLFCLVILGFMFFTTNVYAELVSIDDFIVAFSESEYVQAFKELGMNITASVDEANGKLNFYGNGSLDASYNYTSEYIEYDNRSAVITEENYLDFGYDTLYFAAMIETLLTMNGYTGMTIDEEEVLNATYEEHGFVMETEYYEFIGAEDGSEWSIKGEFLKYFKVSLDTDKLARLVEDYGIIYAGDTVIPADPTPTLSSNYVTSNSVTLYPKVDTGSELTSACQVYRSNSKDGTYELVSDYYVTCNGQVGLLDENLEPGTTYYYKTLAYKGTVYSDVIEVTTLSESTPSTTPTSSNPATVENPKTGITSHIAFILILGGAFCVFLYMNRRSKLFKNL